MNAAAGILAMFAASGRPKITLDRGRSESYADHRLVPRTVPSDLERFPSDRALVCKARHLIGETPWMEWGADD